MKTQTTRGAFLMRDRRMGIAMVITLALLSSMVPVTVVAADEVNLLPNGGFERDTDGDGVPDGWLGHPHHFSRQTLQEVQALLDLTPGSKKHCDQVQSIAEQHLGNVRAKLADLERMEIALAELVNQCGATNSDRCPVLESLAGEG